MQLLPVFRDWRYLAIVPLIIGLPVSLAHSSGAAQLATFSSGVNLVEVYATVSDRDGEPVVGLTAADFQIVEDDQRQSVTTFAAGEFPLSVAVAIDRSFSMAGDRLTMARQAARRFIGELKPTDEVMVLAVGSEIETITPPIAVRDAASIHWEAIDAWGTTPLFDAARQALEAIQSRRGRRALVLISDGADRDSTTTVAALIAQARASAVLMYPVAMGRTRPPVFGELANVTGGRSLLVSDPKRLDAELATLARELRFQYLLGYAPLRPVGGGEWRSIQVTVSRPGTRVRARDGYFAR